MASARPVQSAYAAAAGQMPDPNRPASETSVNISFGAATQSSSATAMLMAVCEEWVRNSIIETASTRVGIQYAALNSSDAP